LSKPIKGRLLNFFVRNFLENTKICLKPLTPWTEFFFGVKESDFDGQRRILPKILPFQVVRLFKALSEKFDILGI
jgi:hypothetical protein